MTSTDLEAVIMEALAGTSDLDKDDYLAQARAVLAALEAVGTVEWGVQWPFQDAEFKPLEVVNRAAGKAAAESLAKITPAPQSPPVVVSRLTFPWERAE